jgi:hypothetical protein
MLIIYLIGGIFMYRIIWLLWLLMFSSSAFSVDLRAGIAPAVEAQYPGYACSVFRLYVFTAAEIRDEEQRVEYILQLNDYNDDGQVEVFHQIRLFLDDVVQQIWKLREYTPLQLADAFQNMCLEHGAETNNFPSVEDYFRKTQINNNDGQGSSNLLNLIL